MGVPKIAKWRCKAPDAQRSTGESNIVVQDADVHNWLRAFLDDEADPDPVPLLTPLLSNRAHDAGLLSNRSHDAGERLINTHSGESCGSSTHAKSDDGAELSLEDHVAGERLLNTTLRRIGHEFALDRECGGAILCGRSAELSARLKPFPVGHVAGERLINTHSGESCGSSTHAKSDDGAELSLEDHVAG